MEQRPLIISENDALVDDLVRISAAAGAKASVVSDAGAARGLWSRASMVLIDDEAARSQQSRQLRRRAEVVLVTYDAAGESVWKDAVAIGAEHVVALPEGEEWLVERLAARREAPARAGRVLLVTGACGGAGASSLVVALACAAARSGQKVIAIDGDPSGGGLDVAFGIEDVAGMRWLEFAQVTGRLASDTLVNALPSAHGVEVLSWDRRTEVAFGREAFDSVLDAASRAFDVVIVDAPRLGEVLKWIQQGTTDVILLVPTRVRAVSAALQSLHALADSNVVVVARSTPSLDVADVAEVLGRGINAVVKHDEAMAKRADHGDPPGAHPRDDVAKAAMRVLDTLGIAGEA